ncbi:hypothetical protein [Arthrobacter sp. KK5.5]|uniref:hypothetical protein n=1 Tax=Arthrobacter sp. KK5.5 TaxID=3373084 RepID=UPI003EE70F91
MARAVLVPAGIAAAAGLLVGGTVGGSVGSAPIAGLEQQVSTLRSSLATTTTRAHALEADATGHEDAIKEQQDLASQATTDAESTIAEFKAEQKTAAEKLLEREKVVAAAEKQLKSDQKEFDGAVADREANTIGSGLYEVGVDVKAGKYKTTGPNGDNPVGCYYAWLSSSEADADIVDNNIVRGQAVVTLRNGQFFEIGSCDSFVRQ